MTDEFNALKSVLSKDDQIVNVDDIVKIALDAEFSDVKEIQFAQMDTCDQSRKMRRIILSKYLSKNSKTAALVIARCDLEFFTHSLADKEIISLLTLLKDFPQEEKMVALEILASTRSSDAQAVAKEVLATSIGPQAKEWSKKELLAFYKKQVPLEIHIKDQNGSQKIAQSKSVPRTTSGAKKEAVKVANSNSANKGIKAIASQGDTSKKAISYSNNAKLNVADKALKVSKSVKKPQGKTYCVQSGDSLWKIAKKFNVDIDVLRKVNKIENDSLKPGTTLVIPN